MINEFFDSEELKSEFEIPYLSDKKWIKSFNREIGDETKKVPGGDIFWKLSYEFPELDYLDQHLLDNTILSLSSRSQTPYTDGISYYCQLGIWTSNEGHFYMNIIIKNMDDDNDKNWFIKDYLFKKVEESFIVVNWFLRTAIKLNCNIRDLNYLKN
jgi:hypothetical protein